MLVLMDIEWLEDRKHHINPTQIAAMRVDAQWNCRDRFYSRIRPRDCSFHVWEHVAYTGAVPATFLYAKGIHRVLTDLRDWLREDDVICFWAKGAGDILRSVYSLVLKMQVPQRMVILNDYVTPFLSARGMTPGSPYAICTNYGMPPAGPKHQAENDVAAMQKALGYINYPSALLYEKSPEMEQPACSDGAASGTPGIPDASRPYQFDVNMGLFHKTGCREIPDGAVLIGHPDMKYFFSRKLTACPHCLAADLRKAARTRNRDMIDRTQYQFLYVDGSDVFHRRGCSAILSTSALIKGSVYYDGCASTGRRPCRLCRPVPGTTWRNATQKNAAMQCAAEAAAANAAVPGRTMNTQEKSAYDRYVQAHAERYAPEAKAFPSAAAKDDFYTLTQPRFAFFCAAGYQAFHKRNCRKLQGLSHITGFARYRDAIRAGHTPCKFCKPTSKLDIECSIPITSEKRTGESVRDLAALCRSHGYVYDENYPFFCFATPAGKWKIDLRSTPYILYHINLILTPNNDRDYHRQPRLFLSLLDTFAYIHRHDRSLIDRSGAASPALRDAAG